MLAKEGLMSFRTSSTESERAFERVRRSLLQRDGLPFADVLTATHLAEVFEAEGVEFPDADAADVVDTPALTLWAFLSQMLFTGEQRSCQAAVARVAVVEALRGRDISDTNTGAYCRARSRILETVPQRLAQEMARDCEARIPDDWRWQGRRTFLVDGTTFSMPDTPENQAEYPQAEGLGFPIMRAVALISLATAMIHGLALGLIPERRRARPRCVGKAHPAIRGGRRVRAGKSKTVVVLPSSVCEFPSVCAVRS